jgi:hypothetical protein
MVVAICQCKIGWTLNPSLELHGAVVATLCMAGACCQEQANREALGGYSM